jgi:hypothetical protein
MRTENEQDEQRQAVEWSSADAPEDPAEPSKAANRREALRSLVPLIGFLALTGACVLGLSLRHPAIGASIETMLPAPQHPVDLTGATVQYPIHARLGTLGLSWLQLAPGKARSAKGEAIELEVSVGRRDCERLAARVGGSCGDGGAPLQHLEWLRLATAGQPLSVTALPQGATRFELEQNNELTKPGAPIEWSLTESAPSTQLHVYCRAPTSFALVAAPSRRGGHLKSGSAACLPSGAHYHLRAINSEPIATTYYFNRLRQFQFEASGRRGRIDVNRAKLTVDGKTRTISGRETSAVEFDPDQPRSVWLSATSPVANGPAAVAMRAEHTKRVVLDGENEAPNELERLEPLLVPEILIPWLALLAGAAVIPLKRLVTGRQLDEA